MRCVQRKRLVRNNKQNLLLCPLCLSVCEPRRCYPFCSHDCPTGGDVAAHCPAILCSRLSWEPSGLWGRSSVLLLRNEDKLISPTSLQVRWCTCRCLHAGGRHLCCNSEREETTTERERERQRKREKQTEGGEKNDVADASKEKERERRRERNSWRRRRERRCVCSIAVMAALCILCCLGPPYPILSLLLVLYLYTLSCTERLCCGCVHIIHLHKSVHSVHMLCSSRWLCLFQTAALLTFLLAVLLQPNAGERETTASPQSTVAGGVHSRREVYIERESVRHVFVLLQRVHHCKYCMRSYRPANSLLN